MTATRDCQLISKKQSPSRREKCVHGDPVAPDTRVAARPVSGEAGRPRAPPFLGKRRRQDAPVFQAPSAKTSY